MEPVGLAVGILSLYNTFIEVSSRVRDYREFGVESQTTLLRFDASKLKLQNWAKALGIQDGKLIDSHDPRLDDPQTASVIQNVLRWSTTAFDKVEARSASLRLPLRQHSAGTGGWSLPSDDIKNEVDRRQNSSTKSRIAWATGGKAKLSKDVYSFEELVNILSDVVPPREIEGASKVKSSRLNEKLDLLTDYDNGWERLLDVAAQQKRHDSDAWLDAIKDDDPYERLVNALLNETCAWIRSHPSYISWEFQDSDDGIAKLLWIHGGAGFGKTVLTASLIQHFRETSGVPLAYCFSANHAKSVHELDGIVRTWITQLIWKDNTILDLANRMRLKQNTRRASRDDVWTLLKDIVTEIQSGVLVLDGLDEFQSIDDRRREFLADIKKAVQATNFRVLITSRNEFDIESQLRPSAAELPNYKILECKITRDDVKDDIDLFSRYIVDEKLPKQEYSLRQELATRMAERCDGQFLWLKLQKDRLRDSKSAKALRDIVQAMPERLHSVYERSWNDIQALEEPDRGRAIDILRWLTFAYDPLTVQELAEAVVINVDGDMVAFSEDDIPANIDDEYIDGEIKNLCGSLIELRDNAVRPGPRFSTVRLVHASVREFLVERLPAPPFVGSISDKTPPSAAHDAKLAAQCIRFLDCPEAWSVSEGDYRPFTDYAVYSWFEHLIESESYYNAVGDLVNDFMRQGNDKFQKWKTMYERDDLPENQSSATSFYYACLFGFVPVMEFLYDNEGININSVGGRYGTPLQAVCAAGRTKAFESLVKWKADVTINGGQFGNALNAAAYYGRTSMVRALFDLGASTYPLGPEKDNAMRMAAGQGHVEMVRLLLNEGADINTLGLFEPFHLDLADKSFSTPLHAATRNGHLNVIKILLEQGAETDAADHNGETALHFAVDNNSNEIVELLLHRGADANSNGIWGTPLHLAAMGGYLDIVMQLIDHEAVLDAQDRHNKIPLHEAAGKGHAEVVGFFLENSVSANFRDSNGWTPLHYAAHNGHNNLIKLLIQHRTDINAQSDAGTTPLHLAVAENHLAVVESLLAHDATIKAEDFNGWTPFHIAAYDGHIDLVKLLIQHGADVNAPNHAGSTPLDLAVGGNHLGVAELLVEQGATIEINDNYGWSPLHSAAFHGHNNVIKLLIQHGADINAQSHAGSTPLECAMVNNHLAVAESLLEQGATTKANEAGWTPLHSAVENGHTDLVKRLIQHDADVNAQTSAGSNPLNLAIRKNHLEIAESLLEHGAAIEADKTGFTPLHLAAELAQLNITTRLLDLGADINAPDIAGWTPLDAVIATENGIDEQQRIEEVKLLLGRGAAFATDNHGWTNLHSAAQDDRPQIVALLLDHGIDINVQTRRGSTALQIAVSHKSLNTLVLLLSREADVNISDEDGISPLHKAIGSGTDEVVEYLIRSRADLNAMDCYGMTCLDWLKRLRPHLKVPHSASQGVEGISSSPKIAVLTRTLLNCVTQIKDDNARILTSSYVLGHCFLLLGMEDDARLAYQQRVLFQDYSQTDRPICDGCEAYQNKFDPFFACKACPDTDLCESCMKKHEREGVLDICRDHEFLRIVASEAKFRPSDTQAFEHWLDGIVEKFKDS
ncbi:MAG: hypothetical protein Q9191_000278 [Dirinaria sp. TL-2023a]